MNDIMFFIRWFKVIQLEAHPWNPGWRFSIGSILSDEIERACSVVSLFYVQWFLTSSMAAKALSNNLGRPSTGKLAQRWPAVTTNSSWITASSYVSPLYFFSIVNIYYIILEILFMICIKYSTKLKLKQFIKFSINSVQ